MPVRNAAMLGLRCPAPLPPPRPSSPTARPRQSRHSRCAAWLCLASPPRCLSLPCRAKPSPGDAKPCPCAPPHCHARAALSSPIAEPCCAAAWLAVASRCAASPCRCPAGLCVAEAVPSMALRFLCAAPLHGALQCRALPLLCYASPRPAVALPVLSRAMPMRTPALRSDALPPRFDALQDRRAALLCPSSPIAMRALLSRYSVPNSFTPSSSYAVYTKRPLPAFRHCPVPWSAP